MNGPGATVHIIDDDASLRKSLARLLKTHGYATDVFESASAFLATDLAGRTGCIVLDLHMPGLDGLRLQERLVAAGCAMPIIFLTGRGDIPSSVRAMKAGAADFLTKPVDEETLLQAIGKALAENRRRNEELARIESVRRCIASLTDREREVMGHLITGALNKQIGGELDIAEKTVKIHRGRVLEKMGVSSIAELVRLCALAGFAPAHRTKVP
jgi:FixJ family two-component response regulator